MGRSVVFSVDYPSSMAFSDYSDLYPSAVSFSKLPQFRGDLATFHSDCGFPAKSRQVKKKERKRSSAAPAVNAPREKKANFLPFDLMKIRLQMLPRPCAINGRRRGCNFTRKSTRFGGWKIICICNHRSELWHDIHEE